MAYPGGKNGAGVYQLLINLIPPHEVYIETHLGGGAIMRNKRPAKKSIGIEIDPVVASAWQDELHRRQDLTVINDDAVRFLKEYPFTGKEFIYCDPPYLMETRKSGQLYMFEYDRDQHVELLNFTAQTRGGTPATEYAWFNYPEPVRLHDYSFLGCNFRERERIKRKKQRWVDRLKKMPMLERRALLNAIEETYE